MIWLAGLLGDTQVVALVKLMALARSYGVYLRKVQQANCEAHEAVE